MGRVEKIALGVLSAIGLSIEETRTKERRKKKKGRWKRRDGG
jgi:hypothetical protein